MKRGRMNHPATGLLFLDKFRGEAEIIVANPPPGGTEMRPDRSHCLIITSCVGQLFRVGFANPKTMEIRDLVEHARLSVEHTSPVNFSDLYRDGEVGLKNANPIRFRLKTKNPDQEIPNNTRCTPDNLNPGRFVYTIGRWNEMRMTYEDIWHTPPNSPLALSEPIVISEDDRLKRVLKLLNTK